MKTDLIKKTKLDEELELLKLFMRKQLGNIFDPSIDDWNNIREDAKEYFLPRVISMLDSSGYIKQFNLKPSSNDA